MNTLNIFTAATIRADAPGLYWNGAMSTYFQLAHRCIPFCQELANIPAAKTLAIVAHNEPATVYAIFAALYLQRPIALLHAKSTPEELQRQCDVLEEGTLISRQTLHEWENRALAFSAGNTPAPPARPGRAAGAACILFTSGSSGRPKGVILPESALVASANASAQHLGWQPNDGWILALPLAHVGGLSILLRCLLGQKCAMLTAAFDETKIFDAIKHHQATLISLVPTTLQRLLDHPQHQLLRALRVILLGGAAISDDLRTQCKKRELPIVETYGMTETASQIATGRIGDALLSTSPGLVPLAGTRIDILDSLGELLPSPAMGRIRISGPTVMDRYLGEAPCNGSITSNDVGFMDGHGRLHILGRADEMIITGGENVHPSLVEDSLRGIAGVLEAVVFGVPDKEYGQMVAAALFVQVQQFSRDSLSETLRQRFSAHQRPRRIFTAPIDQLPLLENGKIDRARVKTVAAHAMTKP